MKYEEAITRLNNFKDIDFILDRDIEAIDIAIASMEMQIVRLVIPYESAKNHCYIECRVCHRHLDLYYKYCTECGQKLRDY